MTYRWCGGITDRCYCGLRGNASAGGLTGSRAGTSWRFPPRLSWEVRAHYSAWQRQTSGAIATSQTNLDDLIFGSRDYSSVAGDRRGDYVVGSAGKWVRLAHSRTVCVLHCGHR
jgi:hypothetical protein